MSHPRGGARSIVRRRCPRLPTALVAALLVGVSAQAVASPTVRSEATGRYVVVLRGPAPVSGAHPASAAAVHRDEGAVLTSDVGRRVRSAHQLSLVDGFIGSMTPDGAQELADDPDVAMVVPDRTIQLARPMGRTTLGTARDNSGSVGGLCPSDSRHPLAPEALTLIKANPDASSGAGVRVGIVADGIDRANPEFQRADGSRVIADYRDFVGQGLDAPTYGGEAFLDASQIGAQGRRSYDLADYVNPAQALPAGCTVKVEGVAPGAAMYVAKAVDAYGATTLSDIVQAIDYLVTVDHVDVLNLSLGGLFEPDTSADPLALAVRAALARGVTVVAASGDSGPANTTESPASAPGVIGVGASTEQRAIMEIGRHSFPVWNGRWDNNEFASFSSGGVTQPGGTVSLVAPGNVAFTACTPDPAEYATCTDLKGSPTSISIAGGTSASAPLVSGAAALVIAAYRDAHHGASPAPAVVSQLLTGTARDLGLPATEQGSGLLDVAAATAAARSQSTVVSQTPSISYTALPNQHRSFPVTLRNLSGHVSSVSVVRRSWQQSSRRIVGVHVDPATEPHFVDYDGTVRTYTTTHITVAPHTDRLTLDYSWPGGSGSTYSLERMVAFTPQGAWANDTEPFSGTPVNYGFLDLRHPQPGTWTLVLWGAGVGQPSAFTGTVRVEVTAWHARNTPVHTARIPAERHRTFPVTVRTAGQPGDEVSELVVTRDGRSTAIPVLARTLAPTPGRFAVTLTGGDGNYTYPASTQTVLFDLQHRARDLDVALHLTGNPDQELLAYLIDPHGLQVGQAVNIDPGGQFVRDVQLYHADAQPGRWRVLLVLNDPVNGHDIVQHVTGHITTDIVRVAAAGLPRGQRLAAGAPHDVAIRIRNTGTAAELFTLDPRSGFSSATPLIVTGDQIPLPSQDNPAVFSVPPDTTALTERVTATTPVEAEMLLSATISPWLLGSPATNASVTLRAPYVPVGTWIGYATPVFTDPNPPASTAHLTVTALTAAFDASVTAADGDPWLTTTNPSAPAATPVRINPGQTKILHATITPIGRPGQRVTAQIDVDDYTPSLNIGDVLTHLAYSYTVVE